MEVVFFVVAVILLALAFFALMMSFIEEDASIFGICVVLAVVGGISLHAGFHDMFSKNLKSHTSIYNNLKDEGYAVKSGDIEQGQNEEYYSPDLIVKSGGCSFIVGLGQFGGKWKPEVAVDNAGQSGFKVLTPQALRALSVVCDGGVIPE